jgi:hypothetical protein
MAEYALAKTLTLPSVQKSIDYFSGGPRWHVDAGQ